MNTQERPNMTRKQLAVYQFCYEFFLKNDQIPTTRIIQKWLNQSSQTGPLMTLRRLCIKGWMERNEANRYRFVRPLHPSITEDENS